MDINETAHSTSEFGAFNGVFRAIIDMYFNSNYRFIHSHFVHLLKMAIVIAIYDDNDFRVFICNQK